MRAYKLALDTWIYAHAELPRQNFTIWIVLGLASKYMPLDVAYPSLPILALHSSEHNCGITLYKLSHFQSWLGAAVGLASQGCRAVQTLVLPVIPLVMSHMAATRKQSSDQVVHMEIQRLEGALQQACALLANSLLDDRSNPPQAPMHTLQPLLYMIL